MDLEKNSPSPFNVEKAVNKFKCEFKQCMLQWESTTTDLLSANTAKSNKYQRS